MTQSTIRRCVVQFRLLAVTTPLVRRLIPLVTTWAEFRVRKKNSSRVKVLPGDAYGLPAEAVDGAALALQGVHNVQGGDLPGARVPGILAT